MSNMPYILRLVHLNLYKDPVKTESFLKAPVHAQNLRKPTWQHHETILLQYLQYTPLLM